MTKMNTVQKQVARVVRKYELKETFHISTVEVVPVLNAFAKFIELYI